MARCELAIRNRFFVNTFIKMLFLKYIIIYANLQLRRDNPTKALTFKFWQKKTIRSTVDELI